MSSNISFTGIASGLDTSKLIQNVLRFSQQKINVLSTTVADDQYQQQAFKSLQTQLQTFQIQASQLAQTQGGVFDSKTVTSNNTGLVTAAAGTGAQTGTTSLKILAVAQASQIASQGFGDPNSSITQGTFQIQAGSKTATITIDSTNNTLSGLSKAINNAGIGVAATIVNTGSNDARTQPYRLLLTSSSTGTANAIKITNALGANSNGAVLPNFSTTEIGPAVTATDFTGTSAVTANSGAGNYTGTANDTYTFSIVNGGTVGTDGGIQVSYTNSSGTKTGTLTVSPSDVNVAKDVVDGVQVKFAAGTLKTGDQFTVNVFAPTIQTASNAQVQLGSGAGAVVVQSASNTITNLIPGVTLSVQSADPTKTVQLNVANDVSAATAAITNFVNDYNDFASNLATQTSYTPGSGTDAGTTGPLNGETSLISIKNQLEQQILGVSSSLPSQINRLGALGISVDSSGLLQIDSTKLNSVLTGGVAGVTFDDVKNLFSIQGKSSSTGVQFASGSSKTLASSSPITVHVTQAATQASVQASTSLGASTVIDSSNNTLTLSVNGKPSGTITLASGTYTQLSLAKEIQAEINSGISSSGNSVTVSISNNQLLITADAYGSSSGVQSLTGSALSTLGFTGSETSTGTDVAGSFVVNGVTETAKGSGQILTGNSSNAQTADLAVVVSLTPSQINPGGTDSTLTVTRGLASNLNSTLTDLLDPTNGEITRIGKQISKAIADAQAEVTKETDSYNDQRTSLTLQFALLETTLSNLQNTSNLIANQLANANSNSNNSSSSSTTSTASSVLSRFSSTQ